MSRLRVLGVLGSVVLLSGCAAGVGDLQTVSKADRRLAPTFFQSAAATGETRTEIVGNPFQVPKETLDQIVLDAMQRASVSPQTRFTTQPAGNVPKGLRIAVVLDPPTSFNADAYCRDGADVTASDSGQGRLRSHTVFCAGERSVSEVYATITRPASPDTPAFRSMIRKSVFLLIPSRQRSDPR